MRLSPPPPFFDALPTGYEDFYANRSRSIVKTYFQTRMEVPEMQAPRFEREEREVEKRPVKTDLTERLVQPSAEAFLELRNALVPSRIDLESRLSSIPTPSDYVWTALTGDTPHEKPLELETPLGLTKLSDWGAPPRFSQAKKIETTESEIEPLENADLSELEFVEAEFAVPSTVDSIAHELLQSSLLNLPKAKEEFSEDFSHLGMISLSNDLPQLPLPECHIPDCTMYRDLPLLEEDTVVGRTWAPESIPNEFFTPSVTHTLWDALGVDEEMPEWIEMPISGSSLIEPPPSCVDLVAADIQIDFEVEVKEPQMVEVESGMRSFLDLVLSQSLQESDVQTLPPVVFASEGLVADSISPFAHEDQIRPMAHLELYLQDKIAQQENLRLDSAMQPVPLTRASEEQLSLDVSQRLKDVCSAIEIRSGADERPLCGELQLKTSTEPVLGSSSSLELPEMGMTEMQYLRKLHGKSIRVSTNPSKKKVSLHPVADPVAVPLPRRPVRKCISVELTGEMKDLLERMCWVHQSLLEALPVQERRVLGHDLLDVHSVGHRLSSLESSRLCGSVSQIKLIRETSWFLLHLGLRTAWMHYSKGRGPPCDLTHQTSSIFEELEEMIRAKGIEAHPKYPKLRELLKHAAVAKVCLLADVDGLTTVTDNCHGHEVLSLNTPQAKAGVQSESRPVCILASHQDFMHDETGASCTRLRDVEVIVEVSPSMKGPSLDLLLQRETTDENISDRSKTQSIIRLETRRPDLQSASRQTTPAVAQISSRSSSRDPRSRRQLQGLETWDDHEALSHTGTRSASHFSKLQLPSRELKMHSLTERIHPNRHPAPMDLASLEEDSLSTLDSPSLDSISKGSTVSSGKQIHETRQWNQFKCHKSPRKQRHPADQTRSRRDVPLTEHSQPRRAIGRQEYPKRHRDWESIMEDWDVDLDDSDEDLCFDSSFSTGLESMTEISGLEEAISRPIDYRMDLDSFPMSLSVGRDESTTETPFLRNFWNEDDWQRSRQAIGRVQAPKKRSNRHETPLSRNGLFLDYSRIKRTSTDHSQSREISNMCSAAETTSQSRQSTWNNNF